MALSYNLVQQAIPEAKGFSKDDLLFETLSLVADCHQPKSLFVPIYTHDSSTELNTAIANGAIGAIWEKGKKLPSYTPNHFPVFYTNDLKEGIQKMIAIYEKQLNAKANRTKFIFSEELSLNSIIETYDIAVIKEHISLVDKSKGGE